MARRQRLGVVLLVPQPLATEIDGVRRALGDGALDRIAPHITLVPPVNVAERDLPRAFTLVRTAASTIAPLTLRIGPVATFAPVNPVAYLQVGGEPQVLEALERLRSSVPPGPARAPVRARVRPPRHGRRTSWPRTASTRSPSCSPTSRSRRRSTGCTCSPSCPGRVWQPVADAPLGERPAVVGRGQPAAGAHRDRTPRRGGRRAPLLRGGDAPACPSRSPPGATARWSAAAWGWSARGALEVADLVVAAEHRGQGIGRHLLAAVVALARRRDCELVGAGAPAWRRRRRAPGRRRLPAPRRPGRRRPPLGAAASRRRRRRRRLVTDGSSLLDRLERPWVAVGLCVAVYLPFVLLGYGTDIDVANVLEAGRRWLDDGDYAVSRVPGRRHPRGEHRVPRRRRRLGARQRGERAVRGPRALGPAGAAAPRGQPDRRAGGLVLATNPWFWIAATSLGDFAWALGLLMAGAVAARRDHRVAGRRPVRAGGRLSAVDGVPRAGLAGRRAARTIAGSGAVAEHAHHRRRSRSPLGALCFVPSWLSADRTLDFLDSHDRVRGSAGPPRPVGDQERGVLRRAGRRRARRSACRACAVRWPAWHTSVAFRFAVLAFVATEVLYFRFPFKPLHLLPAAMAVALVDRALRHRGPPLDRRAHRRPAHRRPGHHHPRPPPTSRTAPPAARSSSASPPAPCSPTSGAASTTATTAPTRTAPPTESTQRADENAACQLETWRACP